MTAWIVKGGCVLSIGHNNYNRLLYPYKKKNGYNESAGIHAEMSAIKKISKISLKDSTIIINGVTKAGNKIFTKPCQSCMKAIKAVGIKKVIYFDQFGNKYVEKI